MATRGWRLAQEGLRLCQRYESTGQARDLERGISLLRDGLSRCGDPAERAIVGGNLGTALWRFFEVTGDRGALDESIALHAAAIVSGALGPEDLVPWLHSLGHALRVRYDRTGDGDDLDMAIATGDQLLALPTGLRPPRGLWAAWMSELGEAREQRARLRLAVPGPASPEGLADIDAAVRLFHEAARYAPADYRDPAGLMHNLAGALHTRSGLADDHGLGEQASADRADALLMRREAARLAPADHPYGFRIFGGLAGALTEEADRAADAAARDALLDEAAAVARRGLDVAAPGTAYEALAVQLVRILASRVDRAPSAARFRELIDAIEDPGIGPAAVADTGDRLLMAADALRELSWLSGDAASLALSIDRYRRVLSSGAPAQHEDAAFGLSSALRSRFEASGEAADLDEATRLAREVLDGTASPGRRADCLGHLGVCLMYGAGTDAGKLAEGIGLIRQAISELDRLSAEADTALTGSGLTGVGSGDEEPGRYEAAALSLRSDLRSALRQRYEETGDLADLDEAIDLGRTVVAGPARADDPGRHGADLMRLGISLQVRYRRSGDLADLDEAVDYCREGTQVLPRAHREWAGYSSSLGLALQLRYGVTGDANDLDEAVRTGHAAVDAAPDGHPGKWMLLSNAGLAHRLRSELTASEDDLCAAVGLARDSVTAAAATVTGCASCELNLARALMLRAERHQDAAAREEALTCLRATTREPGAARQTRLQAGLSWAYAATDPADAADAYEAAVDLLELVVWHGLTRQAREQHLERLRGLASEAAASALAAGDPRRALSLLERGRSLLWSQRLRLRDGFGELRDASPGLYDRLADLATALTAEDTVMPGTVIPGTVIPGTVVPGAQSGAASATSAASADGERRQRLAADWDETLTQVRALPGLAGFLRAPAADDLIACAADAPVVILNVSAIRSDALILTGQGMTVLPLPGVTPAETQTQAIAHLRAITPGGMAADAGPGARDQAITECLAWLRDTVTDPVLDELERLGYPAPARVRWCPTGQLGLLPLHAAAHDRAVSSYVRTVGSLLTTETRDSGTRDAVGDNGLLVVAVSVPPDIPGVYEEAKLITARFPGRCKLYADEAATRERVRAGLPAHPYAHFACHGTQRPDDPSRAALLLRDGPLTVLDLADMRLSGELAFLSACRSAAGGAVVPDEAIHLAAAIQAAGYRQVIAALWPIADGVTPSLADDVYRLLAPGGHVDPGRAAEALHAAVTTVRSENPDRPWLWASYALFG